MSIGRRSGTSPKPPRRQPASPPPKPRRHWSRAMATRMSRTTRAGDMPARVKNAAGNANTAEHVKAAAGEALASVAENIGEPARDEAGAAAEALLRQTRRAGDRLSRYATAKPLTALLVAGAVGYGLGYLIQRSQRTLREPRIANAEST